jgi:hypothetical protein
MTSTSSRTHFKTFDSHYASMQASLNHRLEVARADHNNQLISLLEQEKRQMDSALPNSGFSSVIAGVKHLWEQMVGAIAHAHDLQVWTTTDGNALWWHAYNPRSGRSVITDSEAEMRLWIEANYWEE